MTFSETYNESLGLRQGMGSSKCADMEWKEQDMLPFTGRERHRGGRRNREDSLIYMQRIFLEVWNAWSCFSNCIWQRDQEIWSGWRFLFILYAFVLIIFQIRYYKNIQLPFSLIKLSEKFDNLLYKASRSCTYPPVSSQKQPQGDGLTITISPRGRALSSQNMFVDFVELSLW